MARAGIPCRPLKGVGAALLLFGDLGARQSADIDLLVRSEDVAAAKSLAASRGFEAALPEGDGGCDPDLKAIQLEPRAVAAAYMIDLHWSIEMPRLVPVDHADFWASRSPVAPSGPGDADAPSDDAPPRDLVGTLFCLHLWRHGVTLKTLVDFAAFVRRYDDELPAVRRRLRAAGAVAGLDLALALVDRTFGVRSRFPGRRSARWAALPWLERRLGRPFAERGPYATWLAFALQFDGAFTPLARLTAHLVRPGMRDGRLHVGARLRRLGRVARRAAARAAGRAAAPTAPAAGHGSPHRRRPVAP